MLRNSDDIYIDKLSYILLFSRWGANLLVTIIKIIMYCTAVGTITVANRCLIRHGVREN